MISPRVEYSLDAVEAEDNASGVRSFVVKPMRDEERDNERDYDRFNKRTKRDEESAHAHYTARGAGGKGGKSGNGARNGKGGRGNGKGGGRGCGYKGGHLNRDRGGGKGNTAKFDGDCRNCGKYEGFIGFWLQPAYGYFIFAPGIIFEDRRARMIMIARSKEHAACSFERAIMIIRARRSSKIMPGAKMK